MSATIGYIAVSILQIIIYIIYIKEALGLKHSWKWLPMCVVGAEIINYVNETFINNSVATGIGSFLIFFVIALFMAKGSLKKKAIMTITYIVLSTSLELLVVGVFVMVNLIDMSDIGVNTSMRNVLLLIVQIAILLGIQFPVHFWKLKSDDEIKNNQSGLVILNSFMCFFAVLIYGVYMTKSNDFSLTQIIVVCILVLLDFISYYFYTLSIESNKLRIEKEVYRKQAELYTEWYEGIKSAREETSRLRHDMNNHISVLKSVAESENSPEVKVDEICKYIDGLNFNQKTVHTMDSGNILIDAMLDMKKSYARSQNIEFTEEINIPKDLRYNEQDFVIVFGNLLDNAIEGCLQNGGRVQNKISVRMKYDHGNMRMLIKNTYDGSLDGQTGDIKNNFVIETSKRDKKEHGIGLSNVGRIVEKYHGDVIWTAKGREFTVNLLMFAFAER